MSRNVQLTNGVGIGSFTIFDDAVVGDADLGVNFFLDLESRGQSRAKCCTDLLLELNPEVQGSWYPKPNVSRIVVPSPFSRDSRMLTRFGQENTSLETLLSTSPPFSIILYALPLPTSVVKVLDTYATQHSVPLFNVHSAGFYSYFQLRLPGTFPIVDTHPDDTATTDLRLLSPWPALSSFASSMTSNISALDDHDHGHLPLVVILLHYLEEWKANHDGQPPISYADKTAFRKLVSDASRRDNPEGGEENFDEAAAAVMKHVTLPSLPSTLKEVFDYQTQNPVCSYAPLHFLFEKTHKLQNPHIPSLPSAPLASALVWPPFLSPTPLVAPQLLYDPVPDLLVTPSLFATLYMISSWADQTGGMCGPGLHHPLPTHRKNSSLASG